MIRRIRILAAAAAAAALLAPALASADAPIRLNSPTNGDKVLGQEAQNGHGPPAEGLWTHKTVTVDPKTGAKTTITIVASHPIPNPPSKQN